MSFTEPSDLETRQIVSSSLGLGFDLPCFKYTPVPHAVSILDSYVLLSFLTPSSIVPLKPYEVRCCVLTFVCSLASTAEIQRRCRNALLYTFNNTQNILSFFLKSAVCLFMIF